MKSLIAVLGFLALTMISSASAEGTWQGRLVAVRNAGTTFGGNFKDPEITLKLQPGGKCELSLDFSRFNKKNGRSAKVSPIQGTWSQTGNTVKVTIKDPYSGKPIGEFSTLNLSGGGTILKTDVAKIPVTPGTSPKAPVYQAVLKKK